MVADRISIENAKKNKLFYFVANVIIYRRGDGRCLILKRDSSQKVHPEKYCVPGGKLEWRDMDLNNPTRINGDVLDYEHAVEDLLEREVMEEAGIKIKQDLLYINSIAFVRPDNIPVVLVKFAAEYESGDVKINEGEFTDHAWVNEKEIINYDCIDGIKEEVAQVVKLFSK